jgi:hypothetical protein
MGKGEFPETNHDGSERRSDASDWVGAKTWSPRGSSPAPSDRSNKTAEMDTRPHREQISQRRFNLERRR